MTRRIQDQVWYYGFCSRDMVEPIVRIENRGDFVVRATQKGEKIGLAINVKNESTVDNFAIVYTDDNRYCLKAALNGGKEKKFETPLELIEHYRCHPLPNRIRLKIGIKRPQWLIAPAQVVYTKGNMMGSGNFSDVYRGTVMGGRSDEGISCAIKVLKFKNEKGLTELDGRKRFLDEVKLQTAYQHENIVAMIGVVLDCPPIMMIMELCHGGSLDKHLQKRGTRIGEFEKLLYLFEAAMGMRFLHVKGVIHRDLAARNCLIGDDGRVKIGDFGLSLFSPDGATLNANMETVPLRWMAPECLRREQKFSTKTDVWAYGVLIFEVFSNGSKPFADYETDSAEMRMIRAIRRAEMPPPPPETPDSVQAVLKEIWQKDATARPDFAAIIKRLGTALKATKTRPAVAKLVLNELPKVKKDVYPDFDWSEAKEDAKEAGKKKAEAEAFRRLWDKLKDKRDKRRAERQAQSVRRSNSATGPATANSASATTPPLASQKNSQTEKEPPSPVAQSPMNGDGKKKKNWITATIYKLMSNGKEDKIIETKFLQQQNSRRTAADTVEPKSRGGSTRKGSGQTTVEQTAETNG